MQTASLTIFHTEGSRCSVAKRTQQRARVERALAPVGCLTRYPLVDYFRTRLAALKSRLRVFADGRECPFLIALIARSLMRAAFANSFAGISRSTRFNRSSRSSRYAS